MHWLEDTVWLHKLIRHKDGSIVSISNISELEWSDMSNCSSLMRVKLAVIQRQFQMKECDILTVVRQNILWPFLHTFRGVRSSPPPGSTPLVSHPSCRRSFVGRTACEPWSMMIVDGGSPASTFWNFVLGHDNFKPSGAEKALIGGHTLSA